MDHHYHRHPNHHSNHQHHPPRQHHPQLIDSSSSRYFPLRPPPPPPPHPSFPDDHPNLFPPPQRHLPPPPPLPNHHPLSPRLLHHPPPPPLRPPPPPPSPPHHHPYHHHLHHRRLVDDDHHHRDAFRSPNRSIIYDHHHQQQQHQHHNLGEIDRRPRFRLTALPPPPPLLHPPPPPPPTRVPVPPHSPIAHRSPPKFVSFDRVRRQIDSPPRFREDLNVKIDSRARVHPDAIEFHQLRCERDRVDADRRVSGVFDRLEGDFDRERDRGRDRHERYYPEMVPSKEFELNSGSSECRRGPVNDEVVLEDNVNVRRSGGGNGGGSREVSRSPIKFRIGGVEVDEGIGNRGRKEEVQEYNNRGTPKKSVQKKSAFLRIQPGKPQQLRQQHSSISSSSFRNRFDNSSSSNKTPSPLKGKDSCSEGLDRRVSDERVRSSVELDVCFKPTGLVAKPVMAAAPSCSGVDFNVSNRLSDSGIRIDGEGSSNNSSVFKREEKGFKNRVRVSPIMKRLGNQKNVGVRGSDSELSPTGSSGLSGGITSDAAPKGGVLGTDDKNAGHENVSSPKLVRKKRKANSPLSRISRPVHTKTGSRLVNVDRSAGHPSDSSMPSDIPVKQSEELSSGGNVTDSSPNVFVDTDKIDVCKAPTVVDQEDVVGHSVTEASVSKRIRDIGVSEYLPGSPGSLGTGLCESHGNKTGFLQDEQIISSVDEGVTSSVDKCSSDIGNEKESAKGQDKDMVPVLVNNGLEEGSSELMICSGDNVDNNGNCRGNVETLNSVAVLNSISIPADLSNRRENKVEITCPVVDADKPCEPRVFSSPENATNRLSLGGLYLDKGYESESRYSEDYGRVESLSIDVASDKRTPLSFKDDVTIGIKHITRFSDVIVTNDIQEKQCQGSETMLVCNDTTLGREEIITTCKIAGDVLACPVEKIGSLLNRKRKVRTEPDSLDSRISESFRDSAVSSSFPIENALVPVEAHSSAVSGSPCVDSDVSRGNEFAGSCVKGTSSKNHNNDSDPPIDHFSSCGKKRKTSPLQSVFPDAPVSESSDLSASIKTLIPVTDRPSSNLSPQLAEGFEKPKSVSTGKDAIDGAPSRLSAESCSFADNSISGFLCTDSCFTESAPPGTKLSDLSESRVHQKVDGNLMTAIANDEVGLTALESACRMAANDRKSDLQCLPAEYSGDDVEQEPLAMNMDCDGTIAVNASQSSLSGCLQSCVESNCGGVTINSNLLNTPSSMCSLSSSTLDESVVSSAIYVSSGNKLSKDDKKLKQPFATQSSFTSQANLLPQGHKINSKPSNVASLGVKSFAQKSVPLPSKLVKTTTSSSNSMIKQRKNVLTRSEASPSTSHLSSVVNPSNKTHTFPAKPRTWHRTSNLTASNNPIKKPSVGIPPPHRAPYGKALKVQDTSYIRKGNSLVRNPVSGAATTSSHAFVAPIDRSRPTTTDRIGKASVVIESSELPPDGLVTAGRSTPIEMPKTLPLPCSGKTSNNDVVYSRDCESSLHVDLSEGTDNEEALNSSDASLNSFKDTETVVNRNLEDPGIFSDGDLLGSDSKRMIYIKRKSNQLIAASKTSQSSLHNLDKATATSSDINYFKRRKNQLIRASSEGNIQKMVDKDSSKSLSQRALHVYSSRSSSKRLSNKVKSQKYSLVWKLGDSKSCGKGADALRSRRLLSHLLPWKRATYWSRKPLSSRKRGAVYVRSGRGFSLRRSKVISLPGTSLKWSKSMEKRSKKVEEVAALAVAARDSEQKSGSSDVRSKVENSIRSLHKLVHGLKLHPGERIFRIGMFRYRMDPSRRTLQRISDEEASDFTSETEKGARKTYVPKRLLIGSDEYIRIGNGNQLVRDPKRRTRILASEKVRWSLHTARMRLAKKRKFCQFFTRFGKCNKGEGKCPFVHDPSKIAVCTKFLNGLCANSNCKLTHKVIPERMPDCSFFLQGLCSNEKCPYRHVNVNPKASICESFLRGYCAEGNECRKKHSYICPEFEASGSCPQGSRCKLYHPKKGKSKKRKALRDQKNVKGRYFGSGLSVVADLETRPIMFEKHGEPNKANSVVVQRELGDFVSLGVSDDEAQEDVLMSEQTFLCEDGHLNSQLGDFDELIKPLRILG